MFGIRLTSRLWMTTSKDCTFRIRDVCKHRKEPKRASATEGSKTVVYYNYKMKSTNWIIQNRQNSSCAVYTTPLAMYHMAG